MDDDEVLARFAAASIFLIAAGLSLLAAYVGATMESYTSWSDHEPRKAAIFSAANVVAAGLAGLPWGSWPARFAGFALIVPAIFVINAASLGPAGDEDWAMIAAGVAIVLLGGAVAGGIPRKLTRSHRR